MSRYTCVFLIMALAIAGCTDSSDSPIYVPALSKNHPTIVEQVVELPDHNIYRPSNMRGIEQPLPVIVWGNGGCVRHDLTWRTLFERWARAGFVVVAPTIPSSGEDPRANPTGISDMSLMIDWAFAENKRSNSVFEKQLDLGRVVAAGNSCGGIIALGAASVDSRVNAVFVLSGSSGFSRETAAAVMGNILVPVGFAVGGNEDIASRFAQFDYEAMPTGVPGFIAKRFEGDHVVVSTEVEILAEIAEISTNWLDFALYADAAVGRALLENPCPGCASGIWGVEAKHFELHKVSY